MLLTGIVVRKSVQNMGRVGPDGFDLGKYPSVSMKIDSGKINKVSHRLWKPYVNLEHASFVV